MKDLTLIQNQFGKAVLANREYKKGDEVTYDYSLAMLDEDWTMKCHCGSPKCRGVIGEFRFLSQDTKDYYYKLGIVPGYNHGL